MAEAVERLRAGKLVAFPTETVYGLGANALDTKAVAGIFAAKGRPSTNPLIVHAASSEAALPLASDWPPAAAKLAQAFWPGPLTIVVFRTERVPDSVTAGGTTVGLRVPFHPVALQLLGEIGLPIAAPSANRSEEVSPTTAQHVADSLGPWVDDLLILDGGPCMVGIESTVVDITRDPPRILRPGMITTEILENFIGGMSDGESTTRIARSPGQMRRHYSPRTPLFVMPYARLLSSAQRDDGILLFIDSPPFADFAKRRSSLYRLPRDARAYACVLYGTLREMDTHGFRRILVEEPPAGAEWNALHDRLRRAAAAAAAPEKG